MAITYEDRYRRTEDGWRFAERTVRSATKRITASRGRDVRLFVSLPAGTQEGAGDPGVLVDIGRQADEAGLDGVVISDHVLMGNRTDRYQWGPFPFPSEAPWLEPLTVLTAMAAVTERIILTTGVLIVPLRPAPLPGQDGGHHRPPLGRPTRARRGHRAGSPRSSPHRTSTPTSGVSSSPTTSRPAARCGPARRPPSSRSTSRSRTSGPSPDRRDPADHPCCSRARSRPATCGASSSWATAGSRSWARRTTTSWPGSAGCGPRWRRPAATPRR